MPTSNRIKIVYFAISVAANLVAIGLLPITRGFSVLLPTVICLVSFLIAIAMLARLTHSGLNLGIMMPAYAAVVPLGTIAIGILVYGESASFLRVGLLGAACAFVGVANRWH